MVICLHLKWMKRVRILQDLPKYYIFCTLKLKWVYCTNISSEKTIVTCERVKVISNYKHLLNLYYCLSSLVWVKTYYIKYFLSSSIRLFFTESDRQSLWLVLMYHHSSTIATKCYVVPSTQTWNTILDQETLWQKSTFTTLSVTQSPLPNASWSANIHQFYCLINSHPCPRKQPPLIL